MQYPWPGNIRELENVIERAISLSDDGLVRSEHLPDDVIYAVKPDHARYLFKNHQEDSFNLENSEYHLIVSSLEKCGGHVNAAAELLGISRRTLYRKIDKYNLNCEDYREIKNNDAVKSH
jgi:transcriptional regulator of acetoin/glycerol metabolism